MLCIAKHYVLQNDQNSNRVNHASLRAPKQMRVIRANHLGMCFGVRDAIALAIEKSGVEPLTVLGDLVHNESVLAVLRARGITIEKQPEAVSTRTVMVTAHGASERALGRARALGLNVLEATCPLVRVAHHAVARLVAEGYHPVIVGKRGHVEVRGLTEDLAEYDIVLEEQDVFGLKERARFGVAAQTTQPIDRVRHLVDLIRTRFPKSEVRFIDTVCQPTKQRQNAAIELARQSTVVIVVGGANSNNTMELAETCGRYCARVHHIQSTEDLRLEWFSDNDTVGLTAGTSSPEYIIAAVEEWLAALANESRAASAA